jgi:hypothetical protein
MRTFRIPLVLLAAVAATLLSACGEKKDPNLASGTPSPGASYVIGADSPTDADVTPSPTAPQDNGNSGNSGGNNGNTVRGPQIEYFKIKQWPSCPSGTGADRREGQDTIVEWKVTGTDKVTISVDGPGIYGTYGASGEQSFTFGCGDWEPGEKAKHTYLLMTVGGGDVAKKTLTATATVNGTITTPSPAPPVAAPDAP